MSDAAVLLAPADLQACLALDAAALHGLWSEQQWARELEDPRRPCLGVHRGGRLVAVACGWLVADELHITAVAVDPGQRRQGLGRRVLQALLREARGQGAERATLEVEAENLAPRPSTPAPASAPPVSVAPTTATAATL